MLTNTLASLSTSSDQTIARLQVVEEQLGKADHIEDLQLVRLELATCLVELKNESRNQKQQAIKALNEVNLQLAQAQRQMGPVNVEAQAVDRLTGLPARAQAEREIAAAVRSTESIYAVLFIVDRVQLATGRFGAEIGDALVMTFVKHLAENLPKQDGRFRWGSASLLVLMERRADLASVSTEVRRVLGRRLEKTFELGRRSVLMTVTSSWTAIPVSGASGADEVIRKLDSFESKAIPAG